MTNTQHQELATVLNGVQGMVALSNYQCDLMDRLYPSPKWIKTTGLERTIHSTKDKRSEALWTNYDPREANQRLKPPLSGADADGARVRIRQWVVPIHAGGQTLRQAAEA